MQAPAILCTLHFPLVGVGPFPFTVEDPQEDSVLVPFGAAPLSEENRGLTCVNYSGTNGVTIPRFS